MESYNNLIFLCNLYHCILVIIKQKLTSDAAGCGSRRATWTNCNENACTFRNLVTTHKWSGECVFGRQVLWRFARAKVVSRWVWPACLYLATSGPRACATAIHVTLSMTTYERHRHFSEQLSRMTFWHFHNSSLCGRRVKDNLLRYDRYIFHKAYANI